MVFFLLVILTNLLPIAQAADKTLQFETPLNETSEMHQTLRDAYRSIFHELGFQFKSATYPPTRGLLELKAGRVDGSLGRIGDVSQFLATDNLVRVDVPVAVIQITRWCRKGVNPSRIKLGVRLGNLVLARIKPYFETRRIHFSEIANEHSIVHMIKTARIDCLLSSDILLEDQGIDARHLESYERQDLVSFELYPWILKRHEAIKEKMESALRQYVFPERYRKKYHNSRGVCQGKLNVLCPDGIIFRKQIDLG